MVRYVVDTSTALHKVLVDHWRNEHGMHKKKAGRVATRFERLIEEKSASVCSGDELVARVRDVFFNGLGIDWGDNQIKIFNTFLFACLPLLYGETWQENKARVLAEWGNKKELRQYVIVSMARRNGKTFVSSGAMVSLLIAVPKIKLVIFSTCKRTSGLMMSAVSDMIDAAFEKGTHVNTQDFIQVSKNSETICYEAFGSKRTISCLPGSVRVSN